MKSSSDANLLLAIQRSHMPRSSRSKGKSSGSGALLVCISCWLRTMTSGSEQPK